MRNLVAFILVLVGIGYGVTYWLDNYTRHNQSIEVPSVSKLQVQEASRILTQRGLRFQVIDSISSREHTPGAIVAQVPEAHARVKQNRIVFLTINANNAQTILLPDVVDLSQRKAIALLKASGFELEPSLYKPYPYRDLVMNVEYRGEIVNALTRLPHGAKLTLLVGDGFITPTDSSLVDTTQLDTLIF